MKSFQDEAHTPELVEIAPGRFVMGSDQVPNAMYLDETPAREQAIDYRFAVGKYPVTFAELRPFLQESEPASAMLDLIEEVGDEAHRIPAVAVSWYEARRYCEWLTRTTSHSYRLLTEVEWEYVCRAGTDTPYWWGDAFDPLKANCLHEMARSENVRVPQSYSEVRLGLRFLTPVDQHESNPWGVYDMHGNVWEWVEDVYQDARMNLRFAPGTAPYHSLRGGSWMDPPLSLRSAVRSWADPAARDANIGFRVARGL